MSIKNAFIIVGTNDMIWNMHDIIDYLVKNQNKHISLKINPEAICLNTINLYKLLDSFKFSQVDIYTENQLEAHEKYNIIISHQNKWLQAKWTIESTYQQWNKNKIFLAFYRRPTANRLGIASHLYHNHNEKSLIHFSCGTGNEKVDHYELDKLLTYNVESVEKASRLIPHLPIWYNNKVEDLTNIENSVINEHVDTIHKTIYQDILIDIVAETHVLGNTFFPTEKTVRPMWLKKPFIIFGSKNYLDYLHQMGFRTFNDFWSEEYDGFKGRDRFNKILKLIDSIALKSTDELEKIYWDMQYTLDYNYNLLLTQTYKKEITYIP